MSKGTFLDFAVHFIGALSLYQWQQARKPSIQAVCATRMKMKEWQHWSLTFSKLYVRVHVSSGHSLTWRWASTSVTPQQKSLRKGKYHLCYVFHSLFNLTIQINRPKPNKSTWNFNSSNMDNSSHWGLIIAPRQEANWNHNIGMYVFYKINPMLMNTSNIQFYDKLRMFFLKNISKYLFACLFFLDLSAEFPRDSKTGSNQPSVFDSSKFYCTYVTLLINSASLHEINFVTSD